MMFRLFNERSPLKPILHLLLVIALLVAGIISADSVQRSPVAAQDSGLFIDAAWYRENLIRSADLWNGGLDGQSGMGSYQNDFTGFFNVDLDRDWKPFPSKSITSVAQSRAIYMNIEAYRVVGPEEGARFLQAATNGIEFLLTNFRDPDYGGFYWEVNRFGQPVEDMKQGYGNVHPILALAQAYAVTQEPAYLKAALDQLAVIKQHFLDPDYVGGIRPGFNRDFTEIIGVNNVDTFTHYFEPLLVLYDVTEGEQQAEIADQIVIAGDFLVHHLYQDQEGYSDRGYVAYNYDEAWQPSLLPYTRETQWSGARQASTGHNIELAFLISRAVERGFNPDWLNVADKLIKFCLEYAIDPEYGGMLYEVTDYDGKPLPDNPDNSLFVWWAQAETARALLHFTMVRDSTYETPFKRIETLFNQALTDQEYGGLYQALDAEHDLAPVVLTKGNIWKVNYHYTMYFVEVLRLADTYPDRITELNTSWAASAN
ncbi:MAG: AGE family epimerase/isomerase [Chloroflexi bacterium]|nr:AGE family epimerase/isomerase [Chloroflexota bacterium]